MQLNEDGFCQCKGNKSIQDLSKQLEKFSTFFKNFYADGQRASSVVHDVLNSLQSSRVSYNEVVKVREDLLHKYEQTRMKLKAIEATIENFQTAKDPLVANDGYTYDREEFEKYMETCRLTSKPPWSSATGEIFTGVLTPNLTLQEISEDLKELLKPLENDECVFPHRQLIDPVSADISEYYAGKKEIGLQMGNCFVSPKSFTNSPSVSHRRNVSRVNSRYYIEEELSLHCVGERSRMENGYATGSREGGPAVVMMMNDGNAGDAFDNGSSGTFVANDPQQRQRACLSPGNADELQKQAILQSLPTIESTLDRRNQNGKSKLETMLGTGSSLPWNDGDETGNNAPFSSSTGGTTNSKLIWGNDEAVGLCSSDPTLPASSSTPSSFLRHPCIRVFGSCMFNDDCRYADFPYLACLNHIKGKCRFGERCKELHVDRDDPQFANSHRAPKA